jgi:hypothetical protein
MRAPQARSHSASAITSGSRAAHSITVSPRASVAAIIRLAVPSTVLPADERSATRAPRSPPAGASASSTPPCIVMRAPSASIARTCRSTGRGPNTQPPGNGTRARPRRASSGPSTQIEARMRRTIS